MAKRKLALSKYTQPLTPSELTALIEGVPISVARARTKAREDATWKEPSRLLVSLLASIATEPPERELYRTGEEMTVYTDGQDFTLPKEIPIKLAGRFAQGGRRSLQEFLKKKGVVAEGTTVTGFGIRVSYSDPSHEALDNPDLGTSSTVSVVFPGKRMADALGGRYHILPLVSDNSWYSSYTEGGGTGLVHWIGNIRKDRTGPETIEGVRRFFRDKSIVADGFLTLWRLYKADASRVPGTVEGCNRLYFPDGGLLPVRSMRTSARTGGDHARHEEELKRKLRKRRILACEAVDNEAMDVVRWEKAIYRNL